MTPARHRPASEPVGRRFDGQVAVVSGASSGLGRRLALDLAAAGATVVGVARRRELLAEVGHGLRAASPLSGVEVCDLADADAWVELLAKLEATHGRLDVLVNNAAIDPGVRLRDIALEDFRRTFEVNFFAAVAGTLQVLPGMRARRGGIVVNVSSDGGRLPSPGPGAYPASKAALSAFTESVSFRVAADGVRLHVVYPAWMPTDMGIQALARGLRRPPRWTRRSEEAVARRVLQRMGGPSLDISAAGLIDVAMVFRTAAPRLYHRLRTGW